jgi:hypothetical protein
MLRSVTKELEHDFGIAHTTIHIEGCEPNDMYYVMKVAGRAAENAPDDKSHPSDNQSVSYDH